MLRRLIVVLTFAWIGFMLFGALAAEAQTTQSPLLQQTVAASDNPMAAWQASFSPQMVSSLKTLANDQKLPKGCQPVMVGADKAPIAQAGEPLFAGTRCIVEQPKGLPTKGGSLAQQNIKGGIPQAAPNGGLEKAAN